MLLIVFMTLVPALPRVLTANLPIQGEGGSVAPRLILTLTRTGQLEMAGQATGLWTGKVLSHQGRIVLRVHPDLPLSAPTRVLDEIEGLRPGTKVVLVAWPS